MMHEDILKILSSVMSETQPDDSNYAAYDRLYIKLMQELEDNLSKYNYPDLLDCMDSIRSFLTDLEIPVEYPEIIDRSLCHIATDDVANGLKLVCTRLGHSELKTIVDGKHFAPVPMLLSYGESLSIEVINHVGIRVPISVEDYILLSEGCRREKIAVNKIIQMVSIRIPQIPNNKLFLCDNLTGSGYKKFKRFISCTFLHFLPSEWKSDPIYYKENHFSHGYDGIFCNTADLHLKQAIASECSCPVNSTRNLLTVIEKYKPVYYGFIEEIESIFAGIQKYYSEKLQVEQNRLRALEQCSVRIGMQVDSIEDMKLEIKLRRDFCESAVKDFQILLSSIITELHNLVNYMQPGDGSERFVPRLVFDSLFKTLFSYDKKQKSPMKVIYKQLKTFGYDNTALVRYYIESLSDGVTSTLPIVQKTYCPGNVADKRNRNIDGTRPIPTAYIDRWEQAKIVLLMSKNVGDLSGNLGNYIAPIPQEHFDSGKMLYYLAQTQEGREQMDTLKLSVKFGYKPAMDQIYEMIKSSCTLENLMPMVFHIHTPSCVLAAEKELSGIDEALDDVGGESDYEPGMRIGGQNSPDKKLTPAEIVKQQRSLLSALNLTETPKGKAPNSAVSKFKSSKGNTMVKYCLLNENVFFLKIAASAQSLEALDMLVKIGYEKLIEPVIRKYGFPYAHTDKQEYVDYDELLLVCKMFRPFAQRLVDKTYNTEANKARLGAILCWMNVEISSIGDLLHGKTDAVSLFCKAHLLENGIHCVQDKKLAKELYTNALKSCKRKSAFKAATDRIKALEECKTSGLLGITREFETTLYSSEKSYKSKRSGGSSSGGGCFITTATCIALEEKDDCAELNQLRFFRDHYLRGTREGSELVEEYYRIGPLVVAKINALSDPEDLYRKLWEEYILPTCQYIETSRWDEARDLYISMVVKLCSRFGITINTTGFPNLKKRITDLINLEI